MAQKLGPHPEARSLDGGHRDIDPVEAGAGHGADHRPATLRRLRRRLAVAR